MWLYVHKLAETHIMLTQIFAPYIIIISMADYSFPNMIIC